MTETLPQSFIAKKRRILEQLSIPAEEYDDLSPKGSVDEGIRDLIDEINAIDGCVTTSSCAGRISVFLEGKRKVEEGAEHDEFGERALEERETIAGVGGKGGGGRWLFVSHDPILLAGRAWTEIMGMKDPETEDLHLQMGSVFERRLIHYKFEPMILHILSASLQHAQRVLSAAIQAGFRESGALNLTPSNADSAPPMVGIRSMGLALESVVGFECKGENICMVPEWQLSGLVAVSNQRFLENRKRIERFRALLNESDLGKGQAAKKQGENGEWEDAQARKERMRAEGLERAKVIKQTASVNKAPEELPGMGILEQNL